MALNPQQKGHLMAFTLAAKAIIFDTGRMAKFLPMMSTARGAISAVQSVLGAIETKRKVPPDVAPLLAVNIYMLMVDVAQEGTGMKPDTKIVQSVIAQILQTVGKSHGEMTQAAPPTQPQAPQPVQQPTAPGRGLINQRV